MNDLEHVAVLADRLSPSKQLKLVEHLAHRLNERAQTKHGRKDLRGSWKVDFPDDFDIDAALREIRNEWKKEMDDLDL